MKPIKGIYQDVQPIDQPENTIFYGKNGILFEKPGSVINEPGFKVSSISIPYTPIGVIPLDDKVILFSTNNINSAIGLYDELTDTYAAILNRTDLGFNLNNPITGRAKRNYKGDIICVFRDSINTAKYANLTTVSNLTPLKDLLLFPTSLAPVLSLVSVDESGGIIKTGAYYFSVQFSSLDGTQSNFSKPFGPVYINSAAIAVGSNQYVGDEAGITTTKKIQINISNIDIAYDKLTIAVITKINGIISTKTLPKIDILGINNETITYTGSETLSDITLAEVLTPTANYKTVGSFTQVNGVLYGANLSTDDLIKYQKIANNIKITYNTKLTVENSLVNSSTKYASSRINTTPKGFAHGEVYAFYISYLLDGNNRTPGFIIPGRVALSNETSPSALGAAQGIIAKKFQIEDTSIFISQDSITGIGTGQLGYWENENEIYPSTDDYNSTIDYNGNPLGGEDLRGKPIRHHKFPTISKCKAVHYGSEVSYGTVELDILGIDITNVIIPDEIKDKVQGWEIYYAKRTTTNTTIAGQTLLHFGTYQRLKNIEDFNKVWSTGGNWNIDENDASSVGGSDQLHFHQDYLRFQSFDLALNKPSINPTYIEQQLKLRTSSYFVPDSDKSWRGYLFEYGSSNVSLVQDIHKIRKISNFQYVPRNSAIPGTPIYNIGTEEYAHAKMIGSPLDISVDTLITDIGNTYKDSSDLTFEETYLSTINIIKSDIYNSFKDQELISTGAIQIDKSKTSLSNVHGGDVFIGRYSYITFGPRSPLEIVLGAYNRFCRNFICECVNNVDFRYESATDEASKFYPKSDIIPLLTNINPDAPQNRWAYNKDYTSVNDLDTTTPFNTDNKVTNKFPFRIIRCKAGSKEEKDSISWKTFLANDYFESVQNRGEIINIEAMGNDRLLIHHKDALYITRTNTTLQTDITQIVLGASDIFALPPEEPIPSLHGMLGTQQQLSCLYTKYGYFFIDALVGGVYLYSGSTKESSGLKDITEGLKTFIRDNLNISPINGNIDNPFTGNGITVAFDEKYERIIIGVKNNNGVSDKSFTLSYSPLADSWAFFHDYSPDFIFNTRNSLLSVKTQNNQSNLFIHNKGNYGIYYNAIDANPTPYPFYTDIVFKAPRDQNGKMSNLLLQSINWITEVVDNNSTIWNETFNYVSIRSSYRCSGKIALINNISILPDNNSRRIEGGWNFNEFRDLVIDPNQPIVQDIIGAYDIIVANINQNKPWFDKGRFEDKFFIVRLEYSNINNRRIFLHETNAIARLSIR